MRSHAEIALSGFLAQLHYALAVQSRWFSKRAIGLHVLIALWVPGCLLAGWWQVTVALSGNALGYLYSFEWPVFAIFGMIAWWHAIHDDPSAIGSRALARARASAEEQSPAVPVIERRRESEDADLSAYNDYLAELAKKNRAKTWKRL